MYLDQSISDDITICVGLKPRRSPRYPRLARSCALESRQPTLKRAAMSRLDHFPDGRDPEKCLDRSSHTALRLKPILAINSRA